MLCWGLVEQARHEHMSDEHNTRWYISNVPRFPSWAKVRGTTIKKKLKLHRTRQSQIDSCFSSRNHRSIIQNYSERGPLRRVPHKYNGRSLSGDGSLTGEVVLCWGLVEQARHEHMSDEHKTRWYISNVPRFPSWAKVRDTTGGSK